MMMVMLVIVIMTLPIMMVKILTSIVRCGWLDGDDGDHDDGNGDHVEDENTDLHRGVGEGKEPAS